MFGQPITFFYFILCVFYVSDAGYSLRHYHDSRVDKRLESIESAVSVYVLSFGNISHLPSWCLDVHFNPSYFLMVSMIYLVLFCKVVGCSEMYVYENVTYQWCFILLPIGIGAGLELFIQGFSDKLDLDSDLFCMVVIHSPHSFY